MYRGSGYSTILSSCITLYCTCVLQSAIALPLHNVVQYVCYQLYIQLSVDCTRAHVLDLDSSSPDKFSRHLVFHLPQAVFRNTTYTGKDQYSWDQTSNCYHAGGGCLALFPVPAQLSVVFRTEKLYYKQLKAGRGLGMTLVAAQNGDSGRLICVCM